MGLSHYTCLGKRATVPIDFGSQFASDFSGAPLPLYLDGTPLQRHYFTDAGKRSQWVGEKSRKHRAAVRVLVGSRGNIKASRFLWNRDLLNDASWHPLFLT